MIEENGHIAYRCQNCALIQVAPQPPPAQILAIYEHDAAQTASRQLIAKSRAAHALSHARHTLSLLRAYKKSGFLLEIGPGGGLFLSEAKAAGYNVAGIEPNPIQAAFIRSQFSIPCATEGLSPKSFGGRRFDVMYHCNVLSHFSDPLTVLRQMHQSLADKGILVMETGNFSDVDPQWYPLITETERFQLPDHLFFFGEQSLKILLERSGFELLRMYPYSRLLEKRLPALARPLGLGRWVERLRFFIKYRLGAWMVQKGHPQTVIVIAQKR